MVIREGSACPKLVVCLSERPCPFWAAAVLLCLLAFVLGVAGCGGVVSSTPANASATPPSITAQPASLTVTAGQTATFAVKVTGSIPLNYMWQKNGADIPGATASTYTTPAASTSDNNSQFRAKVSNPLGTVISGTATLTVNAGISPLQVTTSQLPDGTVAGAYSSTLSASGGSAPYTWSLLGGALPAGLTLNVSGTIAGAPTTAGVFRFTVQVSDGVRSTSANLSINIGTSRSR